MWSSLIRSQPPVRKLLSTALGSTMCDIISTHDQEIIAKVRRILPDLNENHHKGQHGRIGILGGSEEYTGAPFFAGISALRVGADLVHIFCARDAAQPIKSYSPDLIVHPLLDTPDAVQEIGKWLERLHVIVVGPGLGQHPRILENIKGILASDAMKEKKLVVDADGLKLVDYIMGIPGLSGILTPNAIELQRMSGITMDNRFTIMAKGTEDLITINGTTYKGAEFPGSGRRCGGQGDLLSGAIAALYHWASLAGDPKAEVVACQGASLLVRLCNHAAFSKKGRGTLAVDMIEEIPTVFGKVFDGQAAFISSSN